MMKNYAVINELNYVKHQNKDESSRAVELTPHDIVLNINGVEAKLDVNQQVLNHLIRAVYAAEQTDKPFDTTNYLQSIRNLKSHVGKRVDEALNGDSGEDIGVDIWSENVGTRFLITADTYDTFVKLLDTEIQEFE